MAIVRRNPNSQRPSSIEPELFDPMTPAQKRDQIALAGQQKHVLENLMLKLKDRAITIKGLIAFEIFKGHPGSVVIPDTHAVNFESLSTSAGQSDRKVTFLVVLQILVVRVFFPGTLRTASSKTTESLLKTAMTAKKHSEASSSKLP